MTVPRSPVNDAVIFTSLGLVALAFINLFVRWAIYAFRNMILVRYVRKHDKSIPLVFSHDMLQAIKRYMYREGALQDANMEERRQKLVSEKGLNRFAVSIWVFVVVSSAGLLVMAIVFGFWPLALMALVNFLFLALFAAVAKSLLRKITGAWNVARG